MRADEPVHLVARLADRLADLGGSVRASSSAAVGHDVAELARSPRARFASGSGGPRGLRGARAVVLGADGLGGVGGDVEQHGAGGGIGELHGSSFKERRPRPCGAPRWRGNRRAAGVSSMNEASPGGWNSGCHCTPNRYDGPVQRIASTMRSGSDHASTTRSRPRSFTAWWCTELVLTSAAPRIQVGEAAARHDRRGVAVLLVERLHAMAQRIGPLRGDVLVERAAHRHVDDLRAAADAEHGLALRRRTRAAARSRSRRACDRRSSAGRARSRRRWPGTRRSRPSARAHRARSRSRRP